MAAEVETLRNWIAGEWSAPRGTDAAEVTNPASGGVVAEAPMSSVGDVADAVQAAHDAFDGWRATPAVDRARLLFRLQALVEQHFEDLSRTITVENGKTLEEARGELLRTLENIEVGGWHSDAATGGLLGRHCQRHRRVLSPRAAGRVCPDRSVQLSVDGAFLVCTLRVGHR